LPLVLPLLLALPLVFIPPLFPPAELLPDDVELPEEDDPEPNVLWLRSTELPELVNTFLISEPAPLFDVPVLGLLAVFVLLYLVLPYAFTFAQLVLVLMVLFPTHTISR